MRDEMLRGLSVIVILHCARGDDVANCVTAFFS
jgi:hypothetical protein